MFDKTIPAVTVAGNAGGRRGEQMGKITFQIERRENRSPNKPLQQPREKVCGELSLAIPPHTQIFNPFKEKKEAL